MATLDEIAQEKQRISERIARLDAERTKLGDQLNELEIAEPRGLPPWRQQHLAPFFQRSLRISQNLPRCADGGPMQRSPACERVVRCCGGIAP
jgi:hypothetical protein